MKSRTRSNSRASSRSKVRRGILETLEKREMLNADWNPELIASTGYFVNADYRSDTLAYINDRAGGSSGGGQGAEGSGNGVITPVSEVEPNDGINNAQFVPLGGNFGVNIAGSSFDTLDEDFYSFDLEAGDIIDARLAAGIASIFNAPLLSLYDTSNRELVSSTGLRSALPDSSPLTGSASSVNELGDVSLSYVVPEAGRYKIRVSDTGTNYSLNLRRYRPTYEAEPAGTKQILFVDFDGGIINRALFGIGVPGSARMSPLSSFLAGYGLEDDQEGLLIDEVMRRVQSKFDTLAANTTNPNFGIEIRNSKDHADPWGQPNVSRVVVGGTWQELIGDPTADPSGILGIAQSVDPGNFDREETAIVMNDVLLLGVNTVPVNSATPRLEYIAELMTLVITHEAGHFFGGWHQRPDNNISPIMDQFYAEAVSSGAGDDGIFGTADDAPLQFGVDGYSADGVYGLGGRNDVINYIGWALTTGQSGGTVQGTTFVDRNFNRTFDGPDAPLPFTQVYADLNNDGVFNDGEFSTTSDANGNYSLLVPAGTHVIRQTTPEGFRLLTPSNNAISVTVTDNQVLPGQNFGSERLDPEITGIKWADNNGNGLRDPGEPGIEGVFIYIDTDGDNRIDIGEPSTRTDANGNYVLQFNGPGTYTIREVVDPGFVQTFPPASMDNEHTIVLTGNPAVDGDAARGLNFGNRLTVDFGDAPESFGVARHGFVEGLRLGANWDSEQVSQFSDNATGDDAAGPLGANDQVVDDEDGVVLSRPLVAGSANNRVSVDVTNTTGVPAYLSAWVDFNQDGDFTDANEIIISSATVQPGTQAITFTAPPSAVLGTTFARFRLSQEPNAGATGEINTGEVEDYQFEVVASLDLAIDDQFTVARNSVQNSLDVLANDFALPGEQLEIVSLSAPSSGGTVQIGTDNTVLYTPPNGFVGQDSFTYRMRNSAGELDTATVIVNVNLFFENPEAIDDSFTLATNSIALPLNVLANDIEGQDGALTIISVTQPDKGGQISIPTGGKSLRYTPPRNFGGTEFFTYTVGDSAGNQSTAQVTLHTLPGDRADDQVLIQLAATDLNGNPISAIQQGQQFKIDVIVDDLRWDAANPGDASVQAGVFAAYDDLLYNLQLVSTVAATDPSDRFNFDVEFDNGFTNFTRGDATIPGIIDEFGALLNAAQLDQVDPVRLASITFVARSPGIATFTPDPADQFPDGDTLLFDTPGSAVPIEQIRYLGTSIEIVGDGTEFPSAVDNTFDVPANSLNFPLDVLANDTPGTNGPVELVNVGGALNGTVRIDTRGTTDFSDDVVLYSPNGGFTGTDQFEYTISDRLGRTDTAQVFVRVGDADPNDIVGLRLQATDLNGQPIDQVTLGSQFQLRGYVDDLRQDPVLSGDPLEDSRGVFAAYQDVLYSASLVSPIASGTNDPDLGFQVTFGPNYQRVREGDIRTVGLINEIGAVSTVDTPLGPDEQLLFVVTMTANSVGEATFLGNPADVIPLHDTLTYEPVSPVAFDLIRYGSDTLQIVSGGGNGSGEGTNPNNRFDVNDDGFVSPIDVLAIVNSFRNNGSGEGEGEGGGKFYLDVSADGYVSPFDALEVINYLNNGGGLGNGEGELAGLLSTPLASSEVASEATLPLTIETEVLTETKIGVRDTGTVMGPMVDQGTFESNADSVFAESDDLGDLLDQLAPEIEKRRNIL